MSILIKGMEKPMSCDDCIVPLSKCDFLQRRADECPIVEIPTPHGRLVDGDKIETEAKETLYGEVSYEEIANAPTILEAEGRTYTIQADSETVSYKNGENQF